MAKRKRDKPPAEARREASHMANVHEVWPFPGCRALGCLSTVDVPCLCTCPCRSWSHACTHVERLHPGQHLIGTGAHRPIQFWSDCLPAVHLWGNFAT